MAIRMFKCNICGIEFKTKKEKPTHCDNYAELIITTPVVKMLECVDKDTKKTVLLNQEKILRERARRHSRDNELDELIQTNNDEVCKQSQWVKSDGTKRKALDDT